MPKNLFQIPDAPPEQELIEVLAQGKGVRMEHIVSSGQTSGWYDQKETEFVSLLTGKAQLQWEDGSVTDLQAGDTLVIPAHQLHRVSYTSNNPFCVWLCVFYNGE